jgi:DNA modification methylase
MNIIHTIINGDSRQMSELSDKSVHLIITSPPYWQLKDYGTDEQNLENKPFINAHLLKDGMAEVDENVKFKYKKKFSGI